MHEFISRSQKLVYCFSHTYLKLKTDSFYSNVFKILNGGIDILTVVLILASSAPFLIYFDFLLPQTVQFDEIIFFLYLQLSGFYFQYFFYTLHNKITLFYEYITIANF